MFVASKHLNRWGVLDTRARVWYWAAKPGKVRAQQWAKELNEENRKNA